MSDAKERPILFSAPMVRALLAGTKTQTRRIVRIDDKPITKAEWDAGKRQRGIPSNVTNMRMLGYLKCDAPPGSHAVSSRVECPYGEIGDRLWVKETWNAIHVFIDHESGYGEDVEAAPKIPKDSRGGYWSPVYAATDSQRDDHKDDRGFGWRPSIFMPRWASRITLAIAGVRVERLHAITEADAWAEGIAESDGMLDDAAICRAAKVLGCSHEDGRATYGALWAEINGEASLVANPWCWVIDFARVVQP